MLINVVAQDPDLRVIEKIIKIINNDGLIVIPTDTIYAFATSMKSKKGLERLAKIKKIFLGLLSFVLMISCGSFQSASYFESDGIYVSKKSNFQESSQEVTQDTYYSQYFQDVADGYIPETTQETYFTDTDAYTSSGQNQSNDIDSAASQIPWGGQTSQTEIIVGNNGPNYFWGGLSGFAFRTSSFWNNYYGDSFRFGYGNFFNPFFNPYQSNFGFWGNQFFNPFMNPYSAYSNFYSPYGYANFWNVNQRWRRNRFMNGYNDQNLNDRDFASTVARVNQEEEKKIMEIPLIEIIEMMILKNQNLTTAMCKEQLIELMLEGV